MVVVFDEISNIKEKWNQWPGVSFKKYVTPHVNPVHDGIGVKSLL